MTRPIGSPVGVFRREIPILRAAILFALINAPVMVAMAVVTHRPDVDVLVYVFAYVTSCGLVVAMLWLLPSISKVTLFEGGIRGPARRFGFRTLAWDEIGSAQRIPFWARSLGIGFDAALCLDASGGSTNAERSRHPWTDRALVA